MVENVTKRRRVRSLALLGVLLGLCIAAAVVWLLYYHNRTYLSDAVANVDGTIETGSNAVELALKGLSESAPADIIQGAPGETTRVSCVRGSDGGSGHEPCCSGADKAEWTEG